MNPLALLRLVPAKAWLSLALAAALAVAYAYWHHAVYSDGYTAGFAAEEKVYGAHLDADRVADEAARRSARLVEFDHAQSIARAAQSYEQDKHDAETQANNVAADLRAGTVRLRTYWQGCQADLARLVSQTAASAGESDAAARSREESAGRAIGAAAACDAQVRGLQQILIDERKERP